MSEKPILFTAPMVRAILAGEKTQTRRVVKCPCLSFEGAAGQENNLAFWDTGLVHRGRSLQDDPVTLAEMTCPYGEVGDRLWVRETFFCNSFDYPEPTEHARKNLYYRAEQPHHYTHDCEQEIILDWKPSIHMPRWASRLTLEITDIRVERVQDITEEDAQSEGCHSWIGSLEGRASDNASNAACRWTKWLDPKAHTCSRRGEFAALWDSINDKRGFGWKANPWVWAISFKRVEGGAA